MSNLDGDQILQKVEDLKKKHEQELNQVMEPARKRLNEIKKEREALDKEEVELLRLIGEEPSGRRRRRGKRMTAMHKKEIVARFINEGHIKPEMEMTKELRTALRDEGFGPHDFRALNDYLPAGWTAKSNGLRGVAACTTFHKNG